MATNSLRRSGRVEDGESSRCIGAHGRARSSHDARLAVPAQPTRSSQGGHHGGIANPGRRSHQGGSHRRPDGPALVRRARQRQRRQDGHRRHQRQGRPARAAPRAVSRGRRDGRRRRSRGGDQAGRARRRRRRLRRHLQLHEAGHQGPGRREGQDALHLPGAVRGRGVRSAHLLHRPGAGAADRPVHPVADARDRARRRSTSRPPTTSGRTC